MKQYTVTFTGFFGEDTDVIYADDYDHAEKVAFHAYGDAVISVEEN